MRTNKIGMFYVSVEVFRHPEDFTSLFRGVVVLDLNHDMRTNRIKYIAYHEQFEKLDEGYIAPVYEAIFQDGEITPTWIKRGGEDE